MDRRVKPFKVVKNLHDPLLEERVLILAPFGRDAETAVSVLSNEGIHAEACSDFPKLTERLSHGAGVLLLTEEVLSSPDILPFVKVLYHQPPWSDLPIIVLTSGGEVTQATLRNLEIFGPSGNVTLVERPSRIITLISTVRVALRNRRRQYEVRRLIQDLKEVQDQLEQRVIERTKGLSQSNLELRRSNQELETFAYVASHDLQDPLRMIGSYTQLLEIHLSSNSDPEVQEFMPYIQNGVKRMQNLIDDLLAFSRIRSQTVTPVEFQVDEVIETVKSNLRTSIQESGAIVSKDFLPTVRADKSQISQLFQNLINNALKFRRAESPKIHISCVEQDGFWIFSVQDNGIGIDPIYFDKIFTIFQRLHTQTQIPGTGMGLAICKKVVENHSGRIWLHSELGKGSTFNFSIPVMESEMK
jgi:signal transduction histidine kinase